MKRVLITASTFAHIVSFHLPYIKALSERGYTVDVACGGEEREIPCAWRLIRLPLEKRFLSGANIKTLLLLHREIRDARYALIITHTTLASFWTRLATFGVHPRPKIITVVHGYLFGGGAAEGAKGAVMQCAELALKRRTDLVLTMNHYDYKWAKKHKAGRVVHNIAGMGVDVSRMGANTALPPCFADFAAEDVVCVYPAEFSARKNQAVLIRAMQYLPDNVKLVLAGDGALRGACQALAKELGVEKRVAFTGYIDNIPTVLHSADIAVTSSRSEGLPFNVMEAMLCGLPVVASRVKGNEDLVQDGVTGFLCDRDNAKAYADAILRLANDADLKKKLGHNGQTLAAREYTLTAAMPEVMAEYISMLDGDEQNGRKA